MRECISVHVGQAGVQMGNACWELNYTGLEVKEDSPRHMLACPGLREEGREAVVRHRGLVGGKGAVGLKTVFKAVELPAGVSHLDTGLANVDRDAFPHDAGLRLAWLVS